jgi:hypothetical protein
LPLRTTIVVIDMIAPVVPLKQSGPDQLRNRPADIGFAGRVYLKTDCVFHDGFDLFNIRRKRTGYVHLLADRLFESNALRVTLPHGHQCIA